MKDADLCIIYVKHVMILSPDCNWPCICEDVLLSNEEQSGDDRKSRNEFSHIVDNRLFLHLFDFKAFV